MAAAEVPEHEVHPHGQLGKLQQCRGQWIVSS